MEKENKFVRRLLQGCGIGEGFLKTAVSLNKVLGRECRYLKIAKEFFPQEIYYIPKEYDGEGFVGGRYQVSISHNQKVAGVRLVGQRKFQGKVSEFDVILIWINYYSAAFVGDLQENLRIRESLIDNLIKALEDRLNQ